MEHIRSIVSWTNLADYLNFEYEEFCFRLELQRVII